MTLPPGTRLGPYEIVAALAAGGMGEVYRARDTKLGRDVAIKVLPDRYAHSPSALSRFELEARAASALNHPHIVQIYAIDRAEVASAHGGFVHFIAMEYLDGEPLRALISRPGNLRRKLELMTQVADALARAHSAGIVHRDLKPDNVMTTPDGYAKLVDFGLAKLIEGEGGPLAGRGAQLPTTEGIVLGTVGYMSPEQVQGQAVDHRSDVFSYGCVLFEVVTGRLPFEGATTIDVLHKIVYEPPPSLSSAEWGLPPALQWVLRKCLEKVPGERYQTMKDVAVDLREVRREYESRSSSRDALVRPLLASDPPPVAPESAALPALPGRRRWWIAAAAALALALVVALAAPRLLRRRQEAPPASGFDTMKIVRMTNTGNVVMAAISPDGKYLAYVASRGGKDSLVMRQTDVASTVTIVPPSSAEYGFLAFTGDGNNIYYQLYPESTAEEAGDVEPKSTIYRIPALGGSPEKVASGYITFAAFSPDGRRLASMRRTDGGSGALTLEVAAPGEPGTAAKVAPVRLDSADAAPLAWSPDGSRIVLCGREDSSQWHEDMFVYDVAASRLTKVAIPRWRSLNSLSWIPGGGELVATVYEKSITLPSQIWRVSLGGARPRRITNDLHDYDGTSVDASGTRLVTVKREESSALYLGQVDIASGELRTTRVPGASDLRLADVAWTPGGDLVTGGIESGALDLWIGAPDGERRQITRDAFSNFLPVVSPDGRYIVFTSTRSGPNRLWRTDIEGGNPVQLTSGTFDFHADIAPDGRSLVYLDQAARTIRSLSIDGGNAVPLTRPGDCYRPALSPDGKLIACSRWREKGELAILPAGGGAPIRVLPIDTPEVFAWSADGLAIDHARTKEGVSNLWRQPIDGGPARQITAFDSEEIVRVALSRDGKRVALVRHSQRSDAVMLRDF